MTEVSHKSPSILPVIIEASGSASQTDCATLCVIQKSRKVGLRIRLYDCW